VKISQQTIPTQSRGRKRGGRHLCFTLDLAEDLISKYICQPFSSSHVFEGNDCDDMIEKDCL